MHYAKYREDECVVAEVGVFKGGFRQMWKEYFGNKATIIGVDIEKDVKSFEAERIYIEIGFQSDWGLTLEKNPVIDVFIDYGGHKMVQQIVIFEEMFG